MQNLHSRAKCVFRISDWIGEQFLNEKHGNRGKQIVFVMVVFPSIEFDV